MKVLIVEDEPLAQQEIIRLLTQVRPEAEVVNCLDSIEDTVAYLTETSNPCDLILLDIELADGSSFAIFEQVKVETPVIFTTAYNEYAIRAFKVNSIDYLLKPVDPEALDQALTKFEQLYQKTDDVQLTTAKLQELIAGMSGGRGGYRSRFVVMIGDKIKYIPTEDIAYFYAEDNTVYLVQHDKRKYMVNHNLEQLETMVDPAQFFRITRRYIANIKAIGDVYKHFNSRLKINLIPAVDDQVLVSRVKVPEFMRWLGS